jgi:hypothetical protein
MSTGGGAWHTWWWQSSAHCLPTHIGGEVCECTHVSMHIVYHHKCTPPTTGWPCSVRTVHTSLLTLPYAHTISTTLEKQTTKLSRQGSWETNVCTKHAGTAMLDIAECRTYIKHLQGGGQRERGTVMSVGTLVCDSCTLHLKRINRCGHCYSQSMRARN